MNIFEQIRSSITVSNYLRNKGFTVKSIGGGYQLDECPMCGGHDCFRIFANDTKWSCFQCPDNRIGKDIVDLEVFLSGQNFSDVVKSFSTTYGLEFNQDELNVKALEIKNLALDHFKAVLEDLGKKKTYTFKYRGEPYQGTVYQYLTKLRKHSDIALQSMQIGMSDGMLFEHLQTKGFELKELRASGLFKNDKDLFQEGFIIYPHFVNGKLSHFTCKDPTKKFDPYQNEVRFRDSNWAFYNQDVLLNDEQEDKVVVLVEGEDDCLSVIYKGGIRNCIASIGTLSEEKINYLRVLSNRGWMFIMAYDGDEQGKKYRNKLLDQVSGAKIYDIPISEKGIPEGKDIDDILSDSVNPVDTFEVLLKELDTDPKMYKLASKSESETFKEKTDTNEDKTPCSLEHERFIIKELIHSRSCIEIFEHVMEDYFYKNLHKKMFNDVKMLYDANKTINPLVCYNTFYALKTINKDDEFDEICSISLESDLESVIDILEKYAKRREYIKFGHEVVKAMTDTAKVVETNEDEIADKFFSISAVQTGKSLELTPKNINEINFANDKPVNIIGTPYQDINAILNMGFENGNIVIIAARTGMGKSMFKNNLKKYWCENGIGVLDFTPENGLKVEQARLDALVTGMTFRDILWRQTDDITDVRCKEVHEKISKEWVLYQYEESEKLTIAFITRKLVEAKKQHPQIQNWIVVADLAGKIHEFGSGIDAAGRIPKSLKKMSSLSKKLGFCFVPVVQINRSAEKNPKGKGNKRPSLSDLKDSGGWEEAADLIFFMYREKYYDDTLDSDIVEIIVAKQRHGHVKTFNKLFVEEYSKIDNLEEGYGNIELPSE